LKQFSNVTVTTKSIIYFQKLSFYFFVDDLIILWDEVYLDPGYGLKWCSNPKFILPVPLDSGDTSQPFVLVSFPGAKPNLHAVPLDANVTTEALCQIPDDFYYKKCSGK